METITDAVSVHSIKKTAFARVAASGSPALTSYTLYDYFLEVRRLHLK
jgi:phosphatidylinositol 4-kinase